MTDPQVIVNLGTGGADLNAQNGSSASADSNDAKFLDWPGDNAGNYVYLPDVGSNGLSVADEAALDITGDIDLRMYLARDDWTPTFTDVIFSKWATQESWWLQSGTDGKLLFQWTEDGSTDISRTSTVAVPFQDGEAGWVRATLDVDNGASGHDVKFYTSVDGVTWTQLGSTVTTAGTTSIFSGNASVNISGYFGHSAGTFDGKVYRAQILDGIDGTTVLDIDTSVITSGSASSFTDLTGNHTVTINRSTSGRKSVAVVSPIYLFGTDDYWQVVDNALLDFTADDSFTVLAIVRRWSNFVDNLRVIDKASATATDGYMVLTQSSGAIAARVDSPSVGGITRTSATMSSGDLSLVGLVHNGGNRELYAIADGVFSVAASTSSQTDFSNNYVLRIGAIGQTPGNYANMELIGVSVFRRALTASEIATISTYYQNRLS